MIISENAIKWILCFRSKTFEDAQDVLICNNTKETHLSDVIMKISGQTKNSYKNFSVEEYDILEDPLHVLQQEHSEYQSLDAQADHEVRFEQNEQSTKKSHIGIYRKLYVPVTKSLYIKLVKLSKRETIELDDLEISDYVIYLLEFMDGKSFILRSICQRLMDSEDLNERVKKHCYDTYVAGGEDWIKLTPGWSLSYNDLKTKMRNAFYLVLTDVWGGKMLVSEVKECETRLPVYTYLRNISFLFEPRYLIIHSRFLMNNHEYLSKLYSNDLKNKNKLIVEVDFCIVSEYKKDFIGRVSNHAAEKEIALLRCSFLQSVFIEQLTICFEGFVCDFDMSCCENKNIRLYLHLCYVNSGIVLPCNLTKVSMTDSVINTSIDMPDVLKMLAFKRVVIKRRCHINVGIDCTFISITQVKGAINIPFIKQYFHLTFSDLWSFELQENIDGTIDVLRISNGTCKSDFHIEQMVHMLNLIDIKCSGKTKLIISNNIENAILTNCFGPINFLTMVLLISKNLILRVIHWNY